MTKEIFRAIRDSVDAYITDTTRWLVEAHYPLPMPTEDVTEGGKDMTPLPRASSSMPSCGTTDDVRSGAALRAHRSANS
ncbi:hypothetical protein RSO01_32990 [Reyranella soli]|uniref:Uncharacterized protein n=1 Tax=Reyranella soli TaxID=1230389 RepID=A0A512NB21_9HYPH|nr:hypothetical protein RSO01_32990 [Reyranella soli]